MNLIDLIPFTWTFPGLGDWQALCLLAAVMAALNLTWRLRRQWKTDQIYDRELAHINARIKMQRENASLYWLKAETCEAAGRYREALRYYRIAHRVSPTAYSRSELRYAEERVVSRSGGHAFN